MVCGVLLVILSFSFFFFLKSYNEIIDCIFLPGLFEQRVIEQFEQNQSQQNGGNGTFKNAKLFMNRTRPFGNWLKEAFVK